MDRKTKRQRTYSYNKKHSQAVVNEHDITMRMLDVIRENYKTAANANKFLLTEMEQESKELVLVDGGQVNSSADQSLIGFWESDKNAFMEQVTPGVTFDKFLITPKSMQNSGNVKLTGRLDSGIVFDMNSIEQLGLVINANNIRLDDETFDTLKKLYQFRSVWSNEWSERLNNEKF